MTIASDLPILTPLLSEVRRVTGVHAAFGGVAVADSDHFVIDELQGAISNGLRDLRIDAGSGLGGKAFALGKPVHVRDYFTARGITHDYDVPVREERLKAMFAVPLRLAGGRRGAVYGALRHPELFGERVIDQVCAAARRFEYQQAVDFEVKRRIAELQREAGISVIGPGGRVPVETPIADICAELVHIASMMDEGESRTMIRSLIDRLAPRDAAGRSARSARTAQTAGDAATISPRERDVLVQLATGLTNKQIAERLGVGIETVKSCLRSRTRKLAASNRTDLVIRARAACVVH